METRNKKYHSWTAKHKGKRRSKKKFFCNAPKSYCKPYWESHKAKEKNEIARFLNGVDESLLDFPFHHKNSATWNYW
jgi:hypothetical protein